jgi:hypothetical protein
MAWIRFEVAAMAALRILSMALTAFSPAGYRIEEIMMIGRRYVGAIADMQSIGMQAFKEAITSIPGSRDARCSETHYRYFEINELLYSLRVKIPYSLLIINF